MNVGMAKRTASSTTMRVTNSPLHQRAANVRLLSMKGQAKKSTHHATPGNFRSGPISIGTSVPSLGTEGVAVLRNDCLDELVGRFISDGSPSEWQAHAARMCCKRSWQKLSCGLNKPLICCPCVLHAVPRCVAESSTGQGAGAADLFSSRLEFQQRKELPCRLSMQLAPSRGTLNRSAGPTSMEDPQTESQTSYLTRHDPCVSTLESYCNPIDHLPQSIAPMCSPIPDVR
jgi:hypothetical protein